MLVKNWMSTPVVTIADDDSMHKAIRLMSDYSIKTLPVVQNDRLVGIVTDRDLKRASASDATTLAVYELLDLLSKIKIKQVMTKDPVTVQPEYTIEEAANLLRQKRISGAPVVDDHDRPVGVITKEDLFKVLSSITGVDRRGIQFAFEVEDRPRAVMELTDIIRKYEGHVVSLYSTYEGVPEGSRHVFIRAYRVNREKLSSLKHDLEEKANLLYLVDRRFFTRVIHNIN
ncbi:MAG: CBS domain-containing protein [Deltaproteobacteria bacterium]|jgi:acetoin utilization protein AcuB|nr:CBS domain-containing protein [Deltaproteobacteria bacterium]